MTTGFAAYSHLRISYIASGSTSLLQRSHWQIQRQWTIHAGDESQLGIKRLGLVVLGIDHDGIQPHALRELHRQAQCERQQVLADAFSLMADIHRQAANAQDGGGMARQFRLGFERRGGDLAGTHGDEADDGCAVLRKRHVGFAEAAPLFLACLALQKFVQCRVAAIKPVAVVLLAEQLNHRHVYGRAMSLRNAALGLGGFSTDAANASKSRWVSMSVS